MHCQNRQHQPPRDDDGFEASQCPRLAPPTSTVETWSRCPTLARRERQQPLAPTGIVPMPPSPRRGCAGVRWAAIAATVIALAEAAFIGRMLLERSGSWCSNYRRLP